MKPTDIVQIFSNPSSCTLPEGLARLIHMKKDYGKLQLWKVEFLDQPDFTYYRLIKPTDGKKE
jgi:hypothetical protein